MSETTAKELDNKAYNESQGDEYLTFRLGDEDSDAGHRGFAGISGWGWMNHGDPEVHHDYSDWLFTAEKLPVPTPGSLALMSAGGMLWIRRNRR